ncbi:MAG: VOC family protein [Hamadaea sp.]|uniref:VOC family protein n=1 Tax=Hamadaea sp. TaxID=2024425 RepID=UPI0017B515CB|nr:VOC family protein [Hamadaea sp.]NUR71007.1 VOC family protein [Hamadaea sp.]NUT23688.1 VOC family protein [Hamadaea sp.]
MAIVTLRTVNLDCSDAHAMARFYGGLLGWEPTYTEPDWVLMRDPGGATGLSFQRTPDFVQPTWPEQPDRQQKMIHLDLKVEPADGQDEQAALAEAVALALSLGGTLAEPQDRADLRVVLDPSGHPLCLFLV